MLQFESSALGGQFDELRRKNFGLAFVVDGLAQFVWHSLRKSVVVTSVFRTMQQQRTTYGRGTKKVSPRMALQAADLRDWIRDPREVGPLLAFLSASASPHMFWHAVDICHWPYAPDEIEHIQAFLTGYDAYNQLAVIQAAGSKTVWLHDAGTREPHLHIQYKGPPIDLSRSC